MALEDLRRQTAEQLNAASPDEWGPAVVLAEHEEVTGRFVEEVPDPGADGRPAYRFLDTNGAPFFVRGGLVLLDKRMRAASPARGDLVLIERGSDATGRNGAYQTYGVACEPTPAAAVAVAPRGQLGPDEALPY